MKSKALDWLKLILKFSFSFLILGYMVWSDRLNMSVVRSGFSHGWLMTCALSLCLTALAASLYRWKLLLRAQDIEITLYQTLCYGMIGAFFNTTMPGAVSGDLVKAWYILAGLKTKKKTPVLTSILLDRMMGVFGLVFVASSPLLFTWGLVWGTPQLRHLSSMILLLFIGVVFFFVYLALSDWGPLSYLRNRAEAFKQNKIASVILQIYDACIIYRKHPWITVQAILLSLVTHLSMVGTFVLCAQALNEDSLAAFQYFLLVPMGLLTTAVPIAPAGLGVGHVAFAALFNLAGSSHGAEIFTMVVTLQIFLNLTGVIFYLRSPKVKPVEDGLAQA